MATGHDTWSPYANVLPSRLRYYPEITEDIDKISFNTRGAQFMIAANEQVATVLSAQGVPALYRVHEKPEPAGAEKLVAQLASLEVPTPETNEHVSRADAAKVVAACSRKVDQYVRKTGRGRAAFTSLVLRSLKPARYDPSPLGHAGLGLEHYCHFTSPIRRYPDLTVHRLLDAVIQGRPPAADYDALLTLGEHCSEREQRAEDAERELVKLKLLAYLNTRIGEEMDAVVTGVESYGLFAQGVELPAEGFVHVDSLADDYYQFDRTTHTLSGFRSGNSYRLGDLLRVAVARVDIDRRQLDFRVVSWPKRKAAKTQVRRKATRKRRNS